MTTTIGQSVTGSNNNSTAKTLTVSVPSLTDTADITEAFKVYHLGTGASRDTQPDDNSVAGHLNYIYNAISGLPPSPSYIDGTQNISTGYAYFLNGQTTNTGTAVFYVTGTPTDTSFPTIYDSNSRFPGILTVTRTKIDNNTAHVYQYYQMTLTSQGSTQVGVDSQRAAIFWRAALVTGSTPVWTNWVQAASQESISTLKTKIGGATASDIAYITGIGATSPSSTLTAKLTSIDSLISTATTVANAALPKSNNLAALTDIAAARLNLGIFNFQLNTTATTAYSGKVYVADPAVVGATGASLKSPAAGDLWFW